jgi:hypothetical protein
MDAVPACLTACGLGCQGAEFDEGLYVQLFKVFNGLHQASWKSNPEVLTNNECTHHHILQLTLCTI